MLIWNEVTKAFSKEICWQSLEQESKGVNIFWHFVSGIVIVILIPKLLKGHSKPSTGHQHIHEHSLLATLIVLVFTHMVSTDGKLNPAVIRSIPKWSSVPNKETAYDGYRNAISKQQVLTTWWWWWWWWIRQFLRRHNTAHAVTRAPWQKKTIVCQRYDFRDM